MSVQLGRWRLQSRQDILWIAILAGALLAFELFNFSTTEYALGTFFGSHHALGMASWATVLALAFCGIDFAGLSRLLTPQADWRREPRAVWLLTAAWFLGAAMNAVMTWWAVASALAENPTLGNEMLSRGQILQAVPFFVALLVWLTRILLIGSLASSGDRLLSLSAAAPEGRQAPRAAAPAPAPPSWGAKPQRPAAPAAPASTERTYPRPARAADAPPAIHRRYQQPAAAQKNSAAAAASAAATRSAPSRSGMPLGARVTQPAPANELLYVDLD